MSNTLTLPPAYLLMRWNDSGTGAALTDFDFSNLMCSYGKQADTHIRTHTHILRWTTEKRRQRRTDSDRETEQEETDYSKYQPPPLQRILEDNNVAMSLRHTHTHARTHTEKGGTRTPPTSSPGPTLLSGPVGGRVEKPAWPPDAHDPRLLHPSSLVSLTN